MGYVNLEESTNFSYGGFFWIVCVFGYHALQRMRREKGRGTTGGGKRRKQHLDPFHIFRLAPIFLL